MKAFRVQGVGGESPEAAQLWELGCLGLVEEEGAIVAYFDSERELPLEGAWETLPERDYVAEYQAGLGPVRVGRLVVAPSHRAVEVTDGDVVVWLDPGSAFGTGHHETTRMALASLTRLDLSGRTVLDVGAGTGLLAIAAERLGAWRAYGVDVDAATVPVARENARRNLSSARFALGSLDLPTLPGRFDVVVANLYAELHAQLLPAYAARLLPGGRLAVTGILTRLKGLVLDAVPAQLEVVHGEEDGEWTLLELVRRP
ncbi:MAG: 50S ribosomal protein L11 methyltransferase [Deinococcales bacterium]|nr:50S ribosomal protein L11 methyltransferase [Deinococcales bacterium]